MYQGLPYHSSMAEILVEWNGTHIDDADMDEILRALEKSGVVAEAAEQTTLLKAAWWALALHWVAGDLPHLGFDSLLTVLAQRTWEHYRAKQEDPPTRIDLYGPDDELLATRVIDAFVEDSDGSE